MTERQQQSPSQVRPGAPPAVLPPWLLLALVGATTASPPGRWLAPILAARPAGYETKG